jgi:hypothetical protein
MVVKLSVVGGAASLVKPCFGRYSSGGETHMGEFTGVPPSLSTMFGVLFFFTFEHVAKCHPEFSSELALELE